MGVQGASGAPCCSRGPAHTRFTAAARTAGEAGVAGNIDDQALTTAGVRLVDEISHCMTLALSVPKIASYTHSWPPSGHGSAPAGSTASRWAS